MKNKKILKISEIFFGVDFFLKLSKTRGRRDILKPDISKVPIEDNLAPTP